MVCRLVYLLFVLGCGDLLLIDVADCLFKFWWIVVFCGLVVVPMTLVGVWVFLGVGGCFGSCVCLLVVFGLGVFRQLLLN